MPVSGGETRVKRQRVERTSPDLAAEQMARLRRLFPEVFTEGRVDFDKLRATLGPHVAAGPERFSFTWAGKSAALALLQAPSSATLVPCPAESVNFATTGHAFVEGDNLEVLKLLLRPYFGRVKLIYLDPPYNTGQDFVYPDDYAEPLASYLRLTGQADAAGNLLTRNPETSGRYHSAWLSMMYPRLFLARQLLRADGVIFVSIGDAELANLLLLLNEVFGEENRLGIFTWVKKRKGSHLSKAVRAMTEFVVAYARDRGLAALFGEVAYADKWQYLLNRPNPVGVRSFTAGAVECTLPEGRYEPGRYGKGDLSVALLDPVEVRGGKIRNAFRLEGRFKWGQHKIDEEIALGTRFAIRSLGFGPNMLRHDQARKIKRPTTLLNGASGVGTYEDANEEIKALFGDEGVMDYPKPTSLIKYLVRAATYWDREGIVLDFFAGSCTTAQAVLELNREDGGSRRFLMVQLPEPTGHEQYRTIAEVGKARVRRVLAGLRNAKEGKSDRKTPEDLGFKVFKLSPPNLRPGGPVPGHGPDACAEQPGLSDDPLVTGWSAENVLWEVALREGYGLNTRFAKKTLSNGNTVYEVTDPDSGQTFVVCLDDAVRADLSRCYGLTPERLFVCRDRAIDDTLATRLALRCRLKTI
jgi:adenine-specific DNA-methyltransferase